MPFEEVRTLRREHATSDARLTLLGAWRTVTGAMTRVDSKDLSVLVDCGIAQGRDAESFDDLASQRDVDAVILTHGHTDHIGSLPALFDAGFDGPVYGTRATLELAELNLRDGIRLSGGTDRDIRRFVSAFHASQRRLRYGTSLSMGDARLVLRDAGHILGSSSVDLALPQSRIVLSGDLGRPKTPMLRDPNTTWPALGERRVVDLVVLESTYGDRDHGCTQAEARDKLRRIIQRAVKSGGHVLIPAFAIGRTQTILYHLNALVEDDQIPAVPVAVDTPMGIRVTELYKSSTRLFDREALARIADGDDPLDFDELYAVHKGRDSHRLRELPGPMVIIAGSGMCTGGRIVRHLIDLVPSESTTVLLVGYQAPGTPGHALQRASRGDMVEIGGEHVRVESSIETLSGLSAHADRSELASWVSALPGTPTIALHHGDPEAQRALAELVLAGEAGA